MGSVFGYSGGFFYVRRVVVRFVAIVVGFGRL